MTEIILTMAIAFFIPILIYSICHKTGKRFLNIPIFAMLLIYSVIEKIFGMHLRFGYDINFREEITHFFKYEGMMVFYFLWLPGIVGFIAANVVGAFIWAGKIRVTKRGTAIIALMTVVCLLVSILPFPQKIERRFSATETTSDEKCEIIMDVTYLHYLFRDNRYKGSITVNYSDKSLVMDHKYFPYNKKYPSNNSDEYFHAFSGWYWNEERVMVTYESGMQSPNPIGFESAQMYLSPNFDKILFHYSPDKKNPDNREMEFIGSTNKLEKETLKEYYRGYINETKKK